MVSKIKDRIPVVERLAGLAEECSELAQAALKLRRVYDQTNPTPVSEEDAIEHLYEEVADMSLYLNLLDINWNAVREIMRGKEKRWEVRLNEK